MINNSGISFTLNGKIFITGGTGYIGSRVIPELIEKKYSVVALARETSVTLLPDGCEKISGNALDASTYEDSVKGCDTFIHLIGVRHPGPGKTQEFAEIDRVSIEQAVTAAKSAGVRHFIYMSVAHPAPVMKDFIQVRSYGEKILSESGMNISVIRPWYVLGPGHYWAYVLLPFYKICEIIPGARETALRLGLVRIDQIVRCVVGAAMNPPDGVRIYEVRDIKKF